MNDQAIANQLDRQLEGETPTLIESLANGFSLDLRSLALFRIAISLILIWDLIFRFPTLRAMCTDEGFFTRSVAYEYYASRFGANWEYCFYSFHWISGSYEWQLGLLIVAGVFALMLMFGLQSRIATIASFVLLVSLHIRNPIILSSGDFVLKMTLFWSIFLPLGHVWSLDARRRTKRATGKKGEPWSANSVLSFATVGFMVQMFCLYFFTGVAKWNNDWLSGDAMDYVLRLDLYATDFGRQLLEYPLLMKFTSWATLGAEVFLIWLIFYPTKNGWWRMLNLAVFWSFHIGIALSMDIGLFPYICMVAWLPLIPTAMWQHPWLGGWIGSARSNDPAAGGKPKRMTARLATQVFCGALVCYILIWNVADISKFNRLRSPYWTNIGYMLHIDQHFQMFGHPPKTSPWFVYEGVFEDGVSIDTFRNEAVDHERPDKVANTMPNFHWRRVHRNLVVDVYEDLREPLVDYAVRSWNVSHGESKQLASLRLICYQEDIGPDYNYTDRRTRVWGEYQSEKGAGALLDQLLDDDLDMPF